jgi:hypothetical protein
MHNIFSSLWQHTVKAHHFFLTTQQIESMHG